jgi:hypothetical protein
MRNITIAAVLAAILAACATQPQPAPSAPPAGRVDAKTQLERGR